MHLRRGRQGAAEDQRHRQQAPVRQGGHRDRGARSGGYRPPGPDQVSQGTPRLRRDGERQLHRAPGRAPRSGQGTPDQEGLLPRQYHPEPLQYLFFRSCRIQVPEGPHRVHERRRRTRRPSEDARARARSPPAGAPRPGRPGDRRGRGLERLGDLGHGRRAPLRARPARRRLPRLRPAGRGGAGPQFPPEVLGQDTGPRKDRGLCAIVVLAGDGRDADRHRLAGAARSGAHLHHDLRTAAGRRRDPDPEVLPADQQGGAAAPAARAGTRPAHLVDDHAERLGLPPAVRRADPRHSSGYGSRRMRPGLPGARSRPTIPAGRSRRCSRPW